MAGGNLSPRQKMINMMYLVLTALLALNVSAEILEAFNSLRQSLRGSAEGFVVKNNDTRDAIIAKVNEEIEQGNKKNEFIIGAAKEVQEETQKVMNYLEGVIGKLEEIASKDPETGELHNKKDTEANYRYWMISDAGGEYANDGRGGGEAMKLRNMLNGYVDWCIKFVKRPEMDSTGSAWKELEKELTPIAVDPKDDPNIPESSEGKHHTWEYFTFHSKPVVADLAMMEKFKLDVQQRQTVLLNFLKTKLGAITFKIDSLIAVDAPVSRVVAAGMKFETKLFVAMSSSEIKPEFSGGGITVDPGGNSATMSMTAPGGFGKGQNEKEVSYSAMIKVPKADGSYAELPVQGTYVVRKPEVVITSASVQNLYWKCGNKINVDVPALGEFYDPRFSASQAEVLTSKSDKKVVTIVPSGKTCVLTVKSNTNGQMIHIDDVKYKVIKPPKPSIVLKVNGQTYNGASPISKKSNCLVQLLPDSDFRSALPADARYAISSVDVLSQRSLGAPTKVGAANGNGRDAVKGIPVSLGSYLKQDPPGTKIYFKIDKIYRINFKSQKVQEQFGDRDLYIGAVIK